MATILIRLFIYVAGGVLLATALVRGTIAAGSAQALALPEPALGIPLRYAIGLVAGAELAVAIICLFGRRPGLQLGWLAWLGTNHLVYQIGLIAMHCHPQGTAIGALTDPLQLAGGLTGRFLLVVPVGLTVGSYASIVVLWWQERHASALNHSYIKMTCPGCGTHIKFARQNLGQKTQCPRCSTAITLRQPDLLKMTCFFCQEHIEFPPHAIGKRMPCPHCKMDITLKEPA